MPSEWSPESDWLSKLNDSSSLNELLNAVKDFPASVQLHLLLAKAQASEIDRQEVLKRAISSLAIWDLKQGHALWIEMGKAEAAKRATLIPYERADLLASTFPQLKFAEPLLLPINLVDFLASVSQLPAATRLSLIRFKFEEQLSFSTSSWLRYLHFLEKEMPVATVLLEVADRFTRARPDRKESWLALIDSLILAGRFEEATIVKCKVDCEEIVLAKLAVLIKSKAPEESIKEYVISASESTQSRKFLKFLAALMLKRGDWQTFRSIWKHSLLKPHAKEAPLWLEYVRLETAAGLTDAMTTITSAFKQAINAVTEAKDRETLFTEWLNHERLYGDGKGLLEAKTRIADKSNAEAAAEEKESSAKRARLLEPKSEPRSKQEKFNPQATLFVNNLPYSFTQKDLESFFTPFTLKSFRMHMNGASFKGHASVEFESESIAAEALQNKNRTVVEGRPVFLSPYQAPFASDKVPSALSTKDPKTLFVTHLPLNCEDLNEALKEAFSNLPGFKEIRHVPGKSFAYVEFQDAEAATFVLKSEMVVAGVPVKVAISEPPIKRKADEQEKQKLLSMKPRSLRK